MSHSFKEKVQRYKEVIVEAKVLTTFTALTKCILKTTLCEELYDKHFFISGAEFLLLSVASEVNNS